MLGITRKSHSRFYWWIYAWVRILDMLVSILSFSYLYVNLTGWSRGKRPTIKKEIPLSFQRRIKWWIGSWVVILESLFTILTFGHLHVDWDVWFWT